ncbi:Golgi membrane exchange factor (Ric1p-Rgp1p) subunit [Ilyodon furcidens]|uniref:Golgi membrane exchange factor (Ric1p-Rgp1p) subunit n=1 Tax=Ilyodon furcidens TaxID=33524 RepID=A0ABV0VKQ7_9TELE
MSMNNLVIHHYLLCDSEMLAWASAQIHCQFHASENRVALPAQGNKQDVQADSDTVLIPSRGERGQCVLDTPPKILFCDLRLDPGESKTCTYFTCDKYHFIIVTACADPCLAETI